MSDGAGEIVIRGGSCEIHFDDGLYEKDPDDPKKHKHRHDTVKIQRIEVTEIDGKTRNTLFDKDTSGGFKGEIKITCKYPKS